MNREQFTKLCRRLWKAKTEHETLWTKQFGLSLKGETAIMVPRPQKNWSCKTVAAGLQDKDRASADLQPARDGTRRTSTTASIPPTPHCSYGAKITRSQRKGGWANHCRAHRAVWKWVENRHEGEKEKHGKYQPKGPFGRLHRKTDIYLPIIIIITTSG